MDRRGFLQRAAGVGTCIALAGCAEFGDSPPASGGPQDLLVTGLSADSHGENVALVVELYVDRTEATDLLAEGELSVGDRTATTNRSVRLSGERKHVSIQLLFSDVSIGREFPDRVRARARVGYGGELTPWHDRSL